MVRVSDFPVTCRLCAKVYRVEKLVKIFSGRGASLNLEQSISAHLPVRVTEKDDLPLNLCIVCLRKLNATNEFFDVVVTSDKFLNRLRKKENKQPLIPKKRTCMTTCLEVKEKNGINNLKCEYPENLYDIALKREDSSYLQVIDTGAQSKTEENILKSYSETITRPSESLSNTPIVSKSIIVPTKIVTNITQNDPSECLLQQRSATCDKLSKNNWTVIHKTDDVAKNASNERLLNKSGNIVIGVTSSIAKQSSKKIPMEVLRCRGCQESIKIFSSEERHLFFAYLDQHKCNRIVDGRSREYVDERTETFAEFKERHEMKKRRKRENNEAGESGKHSTRSWPEGDLPADPGPDPASRENIFEDDVRLDDDFHWPMPKRNRRSHKCNSCDFVTNSAVRLKSHGKLHQLDKKKSSHCTSCQHCCKQFNSSLEARKHERLVHVSIGAKNSLCEHCGVMRSQKTLRDHILKQHTVESEIEMQKCDVCEKLFVSPTSLYLHKKTHTVERQHLCDLCGKAFKQRIAMRRHYMLHFPRAPPKFTCDICEKQVTTRGSLRLHLMRHTGEKPQKCPECHMVMRHGLKHHMRLHSDDAPFKCVVCGTDFKRRDYVRRHMRKHLSDTNAQTFQCTECSYAFDDVKSFLIHHRDMHRNEIFTQIKTYECGNCATLFVDSLLYRDHEGACGDLQVDSHSKLYGEVRRSAIDTPDAFARKVCPNNACPVHQCSCANENQTDNVDASHSGHSPTIEANVSGFSCGDLTYAEPSVRTCAASAKTVEHARKSPLQMEFVQRSPNRRDSNKYYENRVKPEQDFRRTRKADEPAIHTTVVLPVESMCLETGAEFSFVNVNKQSVREKHDLLDVNEGTIDNGGVQGYDDQVDQFVDSFPHHHAQSQLSLALQSNNTAYVRDSFSWKHL